VLLSEVDGRDAVLLEPAADRGRPDGLPAGLASERTP
jgi:hypothetical protein